MTKKDGDYRCICLDGYTGRQCQKEMAMPDMELKPPKPDPATSVPISAIKPEIQGVQESEEKPPAETRPEKDETTDNNKDPTVEPLGPIVITASPEIDPAATAGKWPTEPPTEAPPGERDAENET